MKPFILPICILFAMSFQLTAQEAYRPPYYVQLNGHFSVGIPMQGMRDDLEETAIGGGGNLLLQAKRGKPVFIGVEVGSQGYDRESLEYTSFAEGFAEEYRLTTRNTILYWHGLVRFKPFTGSAFQPYFDGILGFKTFLTRTKLYFLNDNDEELVEGYTDRSETALSYGIGAGLQVMLSYSAGIMLDLRCAYLAGPNATYMVRREDASGPFNDPVEAFERATSPTHMLIPQLGITFQLSGRQFEEEEAFE
jgi:hypothetical protein